MPKDLALISALLPTMALLVFILTSVVIALYILTDRRSGHHRRMERMALDHEEQTHA